MKTRKIIPIVLLLTAGTFVCIFFAVSGDILLGRIARSLGFVVTYNNRCTFYDAFIARAVKVNDLKLQVMDEPIYILSKSSTIEFDFSKILKKRAIGLRCSLKDPIFNFKEDNKSSDLLSYLPREFIALQEKVNWLDMGYLSCGLLLYGETAEITEFLLGSDDVKIYGNGLVEKEKTIDVYIKALFSQKIALVFPEMALAILEDNRNGTKTLEVKLKMDMVNKSVKFHTKYLRFEIGGRSGN